VIKCLSVLPSAKKEQDKKGKCEKMRTLKQQIEALKPLQLTGKLRRICPRCGMGAAGVRTAISRYADVYVCDNCETNEALRDMASNPLPLYNWKCDRALKEAHLEPDEVVPEPDDPYNNVLWERLLEHRGHNIRIVTYGDPNNPADVCLECEDCGEVVLDAAILTLCAREDGKT